MLKICVGFLNMNNFLFGSFGGSKKLNILLGQQFPPNTKNAFSQSICLIPSVGGFLKIGSLPLHGCLGFSHRVQQPT